MTKTLAVAFMWSAIAGLFLMAGCSSDNDLIETTSNRCSVTAVTLGGLKAYINTTTGAGHDTTFQTTVSGSYYRMQIDQRNRQIYNRDSLPMEVDLSKIVFSVFDADGTVVLRTLSGEDSTFNMSDSIDFRTPRTFVVYSTDGTARKDYTVTINAHKQDGDHFTWTKRVETHSDIAALESAKAIAGEDGLLRVFGVESGEACVLTASLPRLSDWSRTLMTGDVSGFVPRSVLKTGERYYATADAGLVTSTDGVDWVAVTGGLPVVAASTDSLYALYNNGIHSSADGHSWTLNALDTPDALPAGDCVSICIPSVTYDDYEDLLLVGTRNGETVVWKRNLDRENYNVFPWNYYTPSEENVYTLPVMSSTSLIAYDDRLLMFGLQPEGTLKVYISSDGGRTWKDEYRDYTFPDVGRPSSLTVTTDADHHLWIVCAGSGDVWCGRLNKLSWEEDDGAFEKSISQ